MLIRPNLLACNDFQTKLGVMRFSLHGGSPEEESSLKGFAERLRAEFVAYKGLPEEEPMLVVQFLPRRIGLLDGINKVTQWLDGGPLPEGVVSSLGC